MDSVDKLFLLDAYALIYRAYYAFIKAPRINSKGFNTSAVLGFVNTLEEVLRKEQPSHIGVAFDPAGPTFRHEAYEQYKAQREETPEVIRLSVPIIKDIIRAYRIPILEVPGYEADDVIGTLALEAGRRGIDTYMMTPDKDYGQLVGGTVRMYRPKHTGGFDMKAKATSLPIEGLFTPIKIESRLPHGHHAGLTIALENGFKTWIGEVLVLGVQGPRTKKNPWVGIEHLTQTRIIVIIATDDDGSADARIDHSLDHGVTVRIEVGATDVAVCINKRHALRV